MDHILVERNAILTLTVILGKTVPFVLEKKLFWTFTYTALQSFGKNKDT